MNKKIGKEEFEVEYKVEPLYRAPNLTKKPDREDYPYEEGYEDKFILLTDKLKKAISKLDEEVFAKLLEAKANYNKILNDAKQAEKVYEAQKEVLKEQLEPCVKNFYQAISERYSDISKILNVAMQYKGKLGNFLVSLSEKAIDINEKKRKDLLSFMKNWLD